jgi:hypothetical protein
MASMRDWLRELPLDLTFRTGATFQAIDSLRQALQIDLPDDYVEFMRMTNGAEGMVGKQYLALLPIEEIASHNEALNVSTFAPGLVVFANNGADTAYAFDTQSSMPSIVDVPYVGMRRKEARHMAETFANFLMTLSRE